MHPERTLTSIGGHSTFVLMKQVITAKLKLHATPEQFAAKLATQLAYRDSLNCVSRYAFEHGKMSNQCRLQEGTYEDTFATFIGCRRKWPAMSRDKSGPPTKACGVRPDDAQDLLLYESAASLRQSE